MTNYSKHFANEIEREAISYSTFKKKNARKTESQLEKDILYLEQDLE